jgi:glycosyltransferase involved in cell wall biosynthesis
MKACILLPVYNDWRCLPRLLGELDNSLSALGVTGTVVIINDGGDPPENSHDFLGRDYCCISDFRLIELVRNVGNQNALAIGLSFIRDEIQCDIVVVMDSDGQDAPGDLKRLISTHRDQPTDLITAERSGRSESLSFRICYRVYRWAFFALTGKRLMFGNFSVIPLHHLARLCAMPELPVNFAAALIKSRISIQGTPCYRGARYDGVTSQNFVNLILHGINGVSVFSEIALVRVSLFSGLIICCTIFGIVMAAAIRLFTNLAIAGWATNVVGFLLILMCQALLLSLTAIIVRVQRPASLVVDPVIYKVAIRSITAMEPRRLVEASA